MSLSINNNITSLNAWRNLKTTDMRMSKTMEKLSSGLRINRAADDPAGLVISEKMRAQLVGLDAAVKNSEKAINMIQTAEGALDQVQKLLDKMRQLALDTANEGVNDAASKQANQDELDEAIASITRIAKYTQFGTKKLLDGTLGTSVDTSNADAGFTAALGSMSFGGVTDSDLDGQISLNVTQVADKAAVTLTISAANLTTSQMSSATGVLNTSVSFTINGVEFDVASGTSFDNLVLQINNKTSETGVVATTGATQYSTVTLTQTTHGSNKSVQFTNVTSAGYLHNAAGAEDYGLDYEATATYGDGSTTSTFDAGTGLTMVDSLSNTIALTTTGAVAVAAYDIGDLSVGDATFQIGANENQTVSVTIQNTKATELGIGAMYTDANENETSVTTFTDLDDLKAGGTYTNGVFVDGSSDAIAQAIGLIDEAIDEISSVRGELGAIQSDNLQVQLDTLRVSYENLQAAESGIRDTDMTMEMASFTKYQIMMQAGTAMLAQANQIPNNVLQLLR